MELYMDNESKAQVLKQSIYSVIFIGIFIFSTLIQILAQKIAEIYFGPQNQFLFACILSGISLQLQLLMIVLLSLKCGKTGYTISLVLSALDLIGISIIVFARKQYFDSIGYACIIIAAVISTIIYYQLHIIDKNADNISRLVFQDELTGLPNRKRILSNLSNRTSSEASASEFSLLLIDLDDFKVVNDALGHQVGDIFLREVVHNIEESLPPDSFFGRMGGDEFIVIANGEQTETDVFRFAQKISSSISMPFIYRNKELKISATFGIVQYPKDGENSTLLLQHADMAMYRGKSQGSGNITFYNEEMQNALEKRLHMETLLHTALEHNELYIEYQPQLEPLTHRVRGLEALARWKSPELGQIQPTEFIPVAEENGDIVPMSKWILERACEQYMSVYNTYETPPMLAVNISPVQFRDPDFLDSVKRIVKKTNMDTDHLELEITESVCIMSPELITDIFSQLRNLGIQIAMDDFGTGYSSLSYLRNLPLSVVKIDASFTKTILTTADNKNIIKTIISMAHQLGLKVVAEGVEVNEQLAYLVKNSCDYVQGNLLGKPAPIDSL